MADFCKECCIDMWGEDTKDLAGLSTEEDTHKGLLVTSICEGCGPIMHDHEGYRVTKKWEEYPPGILVFQWRTDLKQEYLKYVQD